MSINESVKLRRSNLTKEQRREAEAAIYGLSTQQMIDQLSPEEIERMRQIVAQHDQTNGKNGIKEFDLNNPPRQPYRHQEYPKTVYDHEGRRSFKVNNREEEREAIDDGLKLEPFPAEPVENEPHLSATEFAEVEKLDEIARRPRRKAQ